MGKQSSRMYYQGKDHKDIYFQGHYHDRMYIGSQLVWEKLKDNKWLLKETNIELFPSYDFKYGNGLFMAVGLDRVNNKLLIRTTENGCEWKEYSYDNPFKTSSTATVRLHYVNKKFLITGEKGIVTTTTGASISSLIDKFTLITLNNIQSYSAFSSVERYISDENHIYLYLGAGEFSYPAGYIKGGFVYQSTDGITWNCINAEYKEVKIDSGKVTYLIGDCYPRAKSFSNTVLYNGAFYGEIMVAKYTTSIGGPSSFVRVVGKTFDYRSAEVLFGEGSSCSVSKNSLSYFFDSEKTYVTIDFNTWIDITDKSLLDELGVHDYIGSVSIGHIYRSKKYNVVLASDYYYSTLIMILLDENCNLIDYERKVGEDSFSAGFIEYGNGFFIVDNYGTHGKKAVFLRTEE